MQRLAEFLWDYVVEPLALLAYIVVFYGAIAVALYVWLSMFS